jgi:DNA-binding CsgD family transcriptional regulator
VLDVMHVDAKRPDVDLPARNPLAREHRRAVLIAKAPGGDLVMAAKRKSSRLRPEKVAAFLEAAYDLDADDQAWLVGVMEAARAVWGRKGPAHGAVYDASDVGAFRVEAIHLVDFPDNAAEHVYDGLRLFTPALVARTFRSLLVGKTRAVGMPEMLPFHAAMDRYGYQDAMAINGLEPDGFGVFVGLWWRNPEDLAAGELELLRRMAHHLAAGRRCRRRLRESQPDRPKLDATEGAEAILDAKQRVVHATGSARDKDSQGELIDASRARDRARASGGESVESLRRWRPLTKARWTLVDSFETNGARYIVARENQATVPGLEALTERERQAVAYVALGQSTKEAAYALGISDVTVRVLLARAATKLGVRTRRELLAHEKVRSLRPRDAQPGRGRRS